MYQANVYNVMIASPKDVASERDVVREVVAEWNAIHSQERKLVLLPVGWESHASPEMGDQPQSILNRQLLKRSDLLVAIFWTRIGTPTASHAGGSVEEIENHISAGKPVMIYFSNSPVPPNALDSEQYRQVREFKESCQPRGYYREYKDVAEFRSQLTSDLQMTLNGAYFKDDGRPDAITPPALSSVLTNEAERFLMMAAADENGTILCIESNDGTRISAGSGNFKSDNRRTVAAWEAALRLLVEDRLIEDRTGEGEVFVVTSKGFGVADDLRATSA